MKRSFLVLVLLTSACGSTAAALPDGDDASADAAVGAPHDSGTGDSGASDSGRSDSGGSDSGVSDSGGSDSGGGQDGAGDDGASDDGGPIVSVDGSGSDDAGCPAAPPVPGTPCTVPDLSCNWDCHPGCDCVQDTTDYRWKCGVGPVPCDDAGTYDAGAVCNALPTGNECVKCCADQHPNGRGDIMLFGQNCPMCSTCTGSCATGPQFDCPISMPKSPCIACEQAGLHQCQADPSWSTTCTGDCSAYVSCFLACPQ
jgi:hypothetical protein